MDYQTQRNIEKADNRVIFKSAIESIDWILANILGVTVIQKAELDKFLFVIHQYTDLEETLENELSKELKVEIHRFLNQVNPTLKTLSYGNKKAQKAINKLMSIATASMKEAIETIELEYAITLGLGEFVEYAKLEEKLSIPLKRRTFDQVRQIWDEFFSAKNKAWQAKTANQLDGLTERFNNNTKDRVKMVFSDTVKAIQDKLKQGQLSGQTIAQAVQAILDDITRDPSTDKLIPRIFKSSLNRAEVIAYTEIHRARQAAILEAAAADNKSYFTWVTMGDSRVCNRCLPLHGKTRLREKWTEVPPLHPRGRCLLVPSKNPDSLKGFIPLKPIIRTSEKLEGKMPDNFLDPDNKEFKIANKLWVNVANYKAKIQTTSGEEKKKYIRLRREANKALIEETKRLEKKGLRWVRPS